MNPVFTHLTTATIFFFFGYLTRRHIILSYEHDINSFTVEEVTKMLDDSSTSFLDYYLINK